MRQKKPALVITFDTTEDHHIRWSSMYTLEL